MAKQDKILQYFVNNPLLRVLFVFEKIEPFAEELTQAKWPDDYVFHIFDGAWFNTKYHIEHTWREKKVVLYFPQNTYTYPHTEETQAQFPLLDLLRANMEFKEDDYATFLQQHQLPEKFAPFVRRHIAELQSAKVSSILSSYYNREAFTEEVAVRGFITAYLGEKRLLEWDAIFVKMIILGLESETKRRDDFFKRLEGNISAKKQVNERLTQIFGRSYDANTPEKVKSIVECLKYNSITQLLDIAAGDNYKSYKITGGIPLEAMNRIYEQGMGEAKFIAAIEELGAGIQESTLIEVYGIDATYYHLTRDLCWPILDAMVRERLLTAPGEVSESMRNLGIKFPVESNIQTAIGFIEYLALYYEKVRTLGTLKLNTAEHYVQNYISDNYRIDTYYRRSLEYYHQLVILDIPIRQTLDEAKKQLDLDYAKLTNLMNLEWLTCVVEQGESFDKVSLGKQEDFFKNEYDGGVKQVIIVSDALRYEVAAELLYELAKEKHIAELSAYRAMLPTETKYCKPALLPHRSLTFRGGEMLVDGESLLSIDKRTEHLQSYKEQALCVKYEEVVNLPQKKQRDLFKSPLVYIFHDTIDEASHGQNPFEVIAACRKAIVQLHNLVNRLHSSLNVTNVVLTADHGFIYNDMKFEEKDKHSVTEPSIEKKTRYYLSESDTPVVGVVKFPLARVSAIESDKPLYVCLPEGTNRMAAAGGYGFAHGGATLQEMIIPVIRSTQRRVAKTKKVGVSLLNHNLVMVSSRLKLSIIQSEAVSMTTQERNIVCCVYNGDEPVTAELPITLSSTDTDLKNRIFEVVLMLNKNVRASMLQLRIYDAGDRLNPLLKETVKNSTMIAQDF